MVLLPLLMVAVLGLILMAQVLWLFVAVQMCHQSQTMVLVFIQLISQHQCLMQIMRLLELVILKWMLVFHLIQEHSQQVLPEWKHIDRLHTTRRLT